MALEYIASICMKGHLLTHMGETTALVRDYCDKCGEVAIAACEHCNERIPGELVATNYADYVRIPLYCGKCGKPYPWEVYKLERAQYLIGMDENLADVDRQQLIVTTKAILNESPTAYSRSNRARILATSGQRISHDPGKDSRNIRARNFA